MWLDNNQALKQSILRLLIRVLGPVAAGAILGFLFCAVSALVIESRLPPPGPGLSYGQQFGVMALLCLLLGAAIGLAVAMATLRQTLIGIVMVLIATLGVFVVVMNDWNDQIATYGQDRSEAVLYYPPLALCGIALIAALLLFPIAIVARRWNVQANAP